LPPFYLHELLSVGIFEDTKRLKSTGRAMD
jgi:hypothetical protein